MPSSSYEYTLVGFSEELDRRPLLFVEPLPAAKVCGACGLVPNVKASLPCEHCFCNVCYEQWQRSGRVSCPLDGDTCSAEEVIWMNHPARSILAKQVLCWNQTSGCNVVVAAADISKHFHRECRHHVARCHKCAEGVLASDMRAHLESHCDAFRVASGAVLPARGAVSQEVLSMELSEVAKDLQRKSSANSMALSSVQAQLKHLSCTLTTAVASTRSDDGGRNERNLEKRLLQEILREITFQMTKQKDQLDGFFENFNANFQTLHNGFVERNEALKESLNEAANSRVLQSELAAQFTALSEEIGNNHHETKNWRDGFSVLIREFIDFLKEVFERLRSTITIAGTQARDWPAVAEARYESWAQNVSKIPWQKSDRAEDTRNVLKSFLSIMPVSTTHTWTFDKYELLKRKAQRERSCRLMLKPAYVRGYCVSLGVGLWNDSELCFYFRLSQGKIDFFLEWPFNFKMKLTIHHELSPQKLEQWWTPGGPMTPEEAGFHPPEGLNDDRTMMWDQRYPSAELESRGFIRHGRILLSLTLEPRDEVPEADESEEDEYEEDYAPS